MALVASAIGVGVIDLTWLKNLVHGAPPLVSAVLVFAAAAIGFASLYFSMAGIALWLTRRVLPRRGIGCIIDPQPLRTGQIAWEIRSSLVSVAVFAGYGALTMAADRAGLIAIRWIETPGAFASDLILLTLFNEVHFYAIHRLLHTPWLFRHVHVRHHRSVTPTPFSTYSFHWLEATLLSSVMILLLLMRDLGIGTVVVFPVVSLVLNTIGHLNYALLPDRTPDDLLAGCRRHTAHHGQVHGNFGFYLPWLDRLFGTRLKRSRPGSTA